MTVRGKVAKPTHHHEARKRVFWRMERVVGSMGGDVEARRAVSFGWEVEERRVIVVFIGNDGGRGELRERGSVAERE